MEKLTLSEDQLIDAVCLFHAKFKNVVPADVEVELGFDDETDAGYTADAYIGADVTHYATAHFIAAIRLYIDEQLNHDSMSARIELAIDDEQGMIAHLEF